MVVNEENLLAWIEQTDKKLERLERNQAAIINGDFWDINTEPKEPLIKDKDIRNAVRAFGKVYAGEPLRFNKWGRSFEIYDVSGDIGASICFYTTELGLTNGKEYTIEELCGEEEE